MGCSPSSTASKDDGVKTSHSHPVSLNLAGNNKMSQQQQQASTDGKPLDGNLIRLGPMSIYRPHQLHVVAAFPKEDGLFGGIRSAAVEKLGWDLTLIKTTIELALQAGGGDTPPGSTCPTIDLIILDYRQPKYFSTDTLSLIKHLKEEKILMAAVAIVKKNFLEKNESGVEYLLDAGIDKVEIDHGITSTSFWFNELVQVERSLVNAAYKLATISTLIAALDHCRDMIQITDAHHRVQFVNRAYEKVLGYSSTEISGSSFLELQYKHHQLQQQQSQVAYQDQQQQQQQGYNLCNSTVTNAQPNQQSRPETANSPTNPAGGGILSESTKSQSPNVQLLSPPAPFHDHVLEELSQGKDWEGNYMYNRKMGDPIFLNSRVLPFSLRHQYSDCSSDHLGTKGRPATHYIYVSDVPSAYGEKSFSSDVTSNQDVGYPLPRGSLKSLRKASYDIKSISNDSTSILRRTSLAKLHSLTIEAPITKVINIIAAAQQNCPLYIAQALERVLEILRTTELYSPQFFDGNKVRTDDPLTTDLLGALLATGPKPAFSVGRRSSNENASRLAPRPSLPDIAEAPTNLQKLLETEPRWDFDILLLEEITEKRPLVWLGMTTFARFGVAQILNTDETTLRNWLTLIEANYHPANTYHNSTHAADVLQATAYFMSTERLKTFLEPLDEAISLIAAIVHDVDHPGRTSAFLTNSGNDLALLYNDVAVLESHHAAFTFKLTLSDPRVNIFKNLDSESYKAARRSIIDMVLATEMPRHFEHLAKFVNVFTKPFQAKEDGGGGMGSGNNGSGGVGGGPVDHPSPMTPTEPDITTLITPDNIVLIKRMLIKCADVANPARPLRLCIEWARRIAEEYFRQTEEEIARNLPPVMPMFERNTCSIPKSQTGFVDFFVADMYEAWDAFLDVPEVLEYMRYNYEYWKELDKKGIRSSVQLDAYLKNTPINENSYL